MALSKIPLLSALKVIKTLSAFGYEPIRRTGSHIHLLHPETKRLVTVPNHPEIAIGTLISILIQADIERKDFLSHLK